MLDKPYPPGEYDMMYSHYTNVNNNWINWSVVLL